jgi:RNA polymerase sigma factor (sigma-70 family)
MAAHPLQEFIRRLCRGRGVAHDGHLSDTQLLERFAVRCDEAAFEVLVWRHGSLVLSVARRLLRRPADVEDVFQATFLTLARKAANIRRGTAVGSWLYKVAYRIALRVRQATARRERREQLGVEKVQPVAPAERNDAELAAVLADEVSRLPERYRSAVVLCYLQGSTTEEAARVLGCPRGTVLSRLASARQRLRHRLTRRGLAPAVALAAVSFGETASAMPPMALITSVIRAALPFAAGRATVPTVSPQAAALARGALRTMLWNKIKIAAVVMCAIGLAGTGAGWLARGRAGGEATPVIAEQPAKPPVHDAAKADRDRKDRTERLHAELDGLAAEEEKQELLLAADAIDARLQLAEARDELRRNEREMELLQEDARENLKAIKGRIVTLEEQVQKIDANTGAKLLEKVTRQLEREREKLDKERVIIREEEWTGSLRPLRKRVFQAEDRLRRIENRQARQREEFAVKRQALLARLQQLEEAPLGLEPADRLRDIERKLEALRREVGELRRSLEKQGSDPRKKP